jgi:hypothetical protein
LSPYKVLGIYEETGEGHTLERRLKKADGFVVD